MCSVKRNSDVKLTTEAELSAAFQQMEMKTDHHVRFGGETLISEKDNNVVIQDHGNGCLSIHLGFLQVGHRYHVSFRLPPEMYPYSNLEGNLSEEDTSSGIFNPNCRLLSITSKEDGSCVLVVDYFAHKEKLMKEELLLPSPNTSDNSNLKLTFHARVLGRGKGTPLLRNGIHCVGVELEDDSEVSDWQGFD